MKILPAPWRWSFIRGAKKPSGCVFCAVQQRSDEEALVLHRGHHFTIILNRYPYSGGHLMVIPNAHLSRLEEIPPEQAVELWSLTQLSIRVLEGVFRPQGFNVGMNLGTAAGAGIRDHLHLHVVPRWEGDSNFMPVVGQTRVMSHDPEIIWKELHPAFQAALAALD